VDALKDYINNTFSGDGRGQTLVFGQPTQVTQFGFDPAKLTQRGDQRVVGWAEAGKRLAKLAGNSDGRLVLSAQVVRTCRKMQPQRYQWIERAQSYRCLQGLDRLTRITTPQTSACATPASSATPPP
jgi:hypothetical protein